MVLRHWRVILLVVIVALRFHAQGNDTCTQSLLDIHETSDINAEACTQFFFDADGKLDIDSVVQGEAQFRTDKTVPPLGFRPGKYWLKLQFKRRSDVIDSIVLNLGNPLSRSARAWFVWPDGSHSKVESPAVPQNIKMFQPVERERTLRIPLKTDQVHTVIVEAIAVAQNFVPHIRSPAVHDHMIRLEYLFYGIYFGIVAIMILYNTALYFVVKDTTYLLYVGTITFFHGLLFSTLTGASKYLIPGNQKIAMMHLPGTLVIALIFALTFSMKFLNSKQSHPRLHRLMQFILFLFPIQFTALMINYHPKTALIQMILAVFVFSTVIFVAVSNVLKRDRSAALFLTGWILMLAGFFSWQLAQGGLFHHNFYTQSGMMIGSAAEIILFSFALGDKINKMRKEKNDALEREILLANEKAHIEAEMTAATAVQETLLPKVYNEDAFEIETFYHSADRVGGDWLWHSTDPKTGNLFAYVGDVAGHGVPSALMTGVICGAATALEDEFQKHIQDLSVEQRLLRTAEILNQVVAQTGSRSNRLVSMCLVCIEPGTGNLTYVNAGHPFPLIWRDETSSIETMANSGSLLGNNESHFETCTTTLNHGDVLFIYTDGFLEARDQILPQGRSRRRELTEIFKSTRSIQELKKIICLKINPYLAERTKLNDDVTFLLLKKN